METLVVIGRIALRLGSGAWTAKLWWDLFAATFLAHSAGIGQLLVGALLLVGFDLLVKVFGRGVPYVVRMLRSRNALVRRVSLGW